MFKSRRRKQLEAKEVELFHLKAAIEEMKNWCAHDCPEIGVAAVYLQHRRVSISEFREKLRQGKYTFEEFKKHNNFYIKGFML